MLSLRRYEILCVEEAFSRCESPADASRSADASTKSVYYP